MNIIDKTTIARRQIDKSIQIYMRKGDPIAVLTLLSPASQILRDLNKNNPRCVSKFMSDLMEEHGLRAGLFWKEFNLTAAKIKHANRVDEVLDLGEVNRLLPSEIMFCISEWMLRTENKGALIVTPRMHVFVNYYLRSEKRGISFLSRFIDIIDRRAAIFIIDAQLWILEILKNVLIKISRTANDST